MKKNLFKRGIAGLLSLVMCLTALVGIGTTTAYAAGERAEVYLVSFPRSGDAMLISAVHHESGNPNLIRRRKSKMLISAGHHENDEEKLHLLMLDDHIPAGTKMY